MSNQEQVVLVNEQDEVLGTIDKAKVHNSTTQLHRGVSVFVFNTKKQILIQKRHEDKITWGGFWSNSFCGHPRLNESYEEACVRRGKFELGLILDKDKLFFVSNYRYKFSCNNIVENEICPIYFAISNQWVLPNLQEISQVKWISWDKFLELLKSKTQEFTPWCIEETNLLLENNSFQEYIA